MRILAPVILLVAIAGAIAIGTNVTGSRADLSFRNRGSIHTLDPAVMSYMEDMVAAEALWEGLMRLNPETTAAIPGIAEAPPEISPDGKRYRFTLRPNARWSNGDPVTANDFIRAWRRAMEPGTADTYAEMISNYLEGATDYVAWRSQATGLIGLIRQLHKRHTVKGSEVRDVLLSEPGDVLRRHLRTPIPDPPPDEADACWSQAVRELLSTELNFQQLGDELLDAHYREMDKRFARVGLRALDDRHLEVRLKLSTPYFVDLAAFSTYLPIHASIEMLRDSYELSHLTPGEAIVGKKEIPLTEAGLWSYDQQWTKPDYHRNGYPGVISNGAYRLAEWHFKQRLRLEANPFYWDAANVRSKTIDMLDIEYLNAAFMLYEQRRVDWVMEMTMDYVPELVREHNLGRRPDIHPIPCFGTYYVTINCRPYLLDGRPNILANVRVRRALTMAVDRKAIAEYVERLNNPVATTFVPRGQIPGYESPKGLDYDPDRARQELAAAGYPGGKGAPPIELLYNTENGHETKMQALKRMWEKELGLTIQLIGKETKAFEEDKNRGRFMLGRGGWFGDYNDPTTFLDLFQSKNGNDVGKFSDPRYDAMLAQAAAELDPAKRLKILSQAEAYVMEEQVPIVPLFGYVRVEAWRPEVTGVYPNPRLQFPLQYVAVQKNTN